VECSKARGFSSALRELPQCEKEKDALKTSVAPAVAVLSSSLASRFGIEAGAATAMAAVALLLSLKMSVNAWCSAVKAKVPEAAESSLGRNCSGENDREEFKVSGSPSTQFSGKRPGS